MSGRVEISKRLVLVNSTSTVLARVLNVSVVLWLQQHLLRRVSEEEYVLLPVLMAVILLLPLFTSVLTSGLGRFIVTAYARDDERGITQIVSTMFPLLVAAAVVLLAAGALFIRHVDRILAIAPTQVRDARIMMALLLLSVALRLPCAPFSVGLYVRQKFMLESLLVVGAELLRLALLAALLLGVSTRVLWVVVANVTAELGLITALVFFSRRLVPPLRVRVREMQWGRARELLSFGGWNFLGLVAWRLQYTMIPLILNQLASPVDLVVYHVGTLPRRQIDQWTDPMAAPLYPVVTGMHASGAQQRIASVYLRGGRLALWTVLVAATPAILYAPLVMRLYLGSAYGEAAPVMALTLASLFLAGGTWLMWQVANATARVRATGLYALTTQLATCGATLYAVHWLHWGGIGAALAGFLVGAVAVVGVGWPLGLRLAGVKFETWVRQTLLPGLLPACLAAPVWLALDWLVRPQSWAALALCTAAGAACYLAVLVTLCLEPSDRADVATLLTRVRRRAGSPKLAV
jgi:O-antigen/teichoic acid export membrane protein